MRMRGYVDTLSASTWLTETTQLTCHKQLTALMLLAIKTITTYLFLLLTLTAFRQRVRFDSEKPLPIEHPYPRVLPIHNLIFGS